MRSWYGIACISDLAYVSSLDTSPEADILALPSAVSSITILVPASSLSVISPPSSTILLRYASTRVSGISGISVASVTPAIAERYCIKGGRLVLYYTSTIEYRFPQNRIRATY